MSILRDEWINRWVDHMAILSSENDEEFLSGLPDVDDPFWDEQIAAYPNSPETSAENMVGDWK